MRIFLIFTLISTVMIFAACSGNSSAPTSTGEIKKGVTPIADDEIAIIEMENSAAFGTIKLELYSNVAPQAVERFKTLAKEGFYDGTTFHRVNQSVIQGGDPNTKNDDPNDDGQGKSDKPNVPAEFSDIEYNTGILGAARSQDINSANSQFFITLKRESGFDQNYTVFGKVIEGMNNARTIAGAQPKTGERPVENIKIKTIRFEKKQ